mmetsp:Transcript_6278/g.15188  ORF Transcript_6278/g.15188 Transcript_6278/m.15188 type:complete len:423 (+) Transcript_6278:934-2202(+)
MRLLDLVEQHHRVRVPPHRFAQLPPRLVANIPGRRPREPGDGVRLHVLRHVDPHHRLLRAVVHVRHSLRQLRLPHPRGATEDQTRDGPPRRAQPHPRAPQRARDGGDRAVLSDHPLVQLLLEVEHAPRLVAVQLRDGDARPLRDDGGDVVHAHLGRGLGAGSALEGGDLHERPRLVDQVDRLVGEEAVGDVAHGQLGGGDEGVFGVAHAVVLRIHRFESGENLESLRDRRLLHPHRLEPALEGGVLLDVLPVLRHRGRADALQLATRQRRLEQVGRVDRALRRARADERVQLVDEEDRVIRGGDLLHHLLEPLLELATVLGVRHQQPELEREHALPLELLRHRLLHDRLRQPLGNRRLAHARVADEHRVVLAAADEDLHAAAHLGRPADHRVELPVPRLPRQVDRALRQRRVLPARRTARAD